MNLRKSRHLKKLIAQRLVIGRTAKVAPDDQPQRLLCGERARELDLQLVWILSPGNYCPIGKHVGRLRFDGINNPLMRQLRGNGKPRRGTGGS